MNRNDRIFYVTYRAQLRRAVSELTRNPYQSASVSAGGGSKSYTYRDLPSLQRELARVEDILACALANSGHGVMGFAATYPGWRQ